MKNSDRQHLLRRSLMGNAAFSTLCGLSLLAGAGPVATWMGLPSATVLRLVGLCLLPFASGLIANARRPEVRQGEAWVTVLLDGAWVLGSVALLVAPPVEWTASGRALIGLVATLVGLFAILQAVGLRRSAGLPGTTH